jgi:hypothetical protein
MNILKNFNGPALAVYQILISFNCIRDITFMSLTVSANHLNNLAEHSKQSYNAKLESQFCAIDCTQITIEWNLRYITIRLKIYVQRLTCLKITLSVTIGPSSSVTTASQPTRTSHTAARITVLPSNNMSTDTEFLPPDPSAVSDVYTWQGSPLHCLHTHSSLRAHVCLVARWYSGVSYWRFPAKNTSHIIRILSYTVLISTPLG